MFSLVIMTEPYAPHDASEIELAFTNTLASIPLCCSAQALFNRPSKHIQSFGVEYPSLAPLFCSGGCTAGSCPRPFSLPSPVAAANRNAVI